MPPASGTTGALAQRSVASDLPSLGGIDQHGRFLSPNRALRISQNRARPLTPGKWPVIGKIGRGKRAASVTPERGMDGRGELTVQPPPFHVRTAPL